MPNRPAYIEFLIEQFTPLGEITTRGMFGGHTLYCNGFVFGLVAKNALFLKTDEANRSGFEARGLRPFRPFDGPGVMQYFEAPPEIFEDAQALQIWVGGSVAAGRRAKRKKPRPMKAKR